MNLPTEQIQKILKAAQDGFKLIVGDRLYKREGNGWFSVRLDGTGSTDKLQPNTEKVQNLSDLREILHLRQEVEQFRKANQLSQLIGERNAFRRVSAMNVDGWLKQKMKNEIERVTCRIEEVEKEQDDE